MAADKPHMGLAAEPAAGDVADLTDLLAPAPREHMFSGEAASEDSAALLSPPPPPEFQETLGPPPHAGASHSSHVSHAERRTCERHFQPSDPVLGSRADPFPGGRLRQPTSGCFSSSSPKKQERGWEPGGGSSLPGPSGISRTEVGRCFALPAACV